MAEARLIGKLALGKGCTMKFFVDDSKPSDSVDSRWTEVTYDGQPDSWVPEIGAHWHKYHDEYMRVSSGRVEFTIDGKSVILTPSSDEPLKIPRWHVHSFRCFKGEATTFVERTDPTGEFKMEFFEDLLDDGSINMVTAFRAFYQGDTYIALPGNIKWLDQAVTWGVGRIVAWLFPQKNKGMVVAEGLTKQDAGS